MKPKDLLKKATPWSGDTWGGRAMQSVLFLVVHGYIPQSVADKARAKIKKSLETAQAANSET
jgi:hypothetical protein